MTKELENYLDISVNDLRVFMLSRHDCAAIHQRTYRIRHQKLMPYTSFDDRRIAILTSQTSRSIYQLPQLHENPRRLLIEHFGNHRTDQSFQISYSQPVVPDRTIHTWWGTSNHPRTFNREIPKRATLPAPLLCTQLLRRI
jgi:hypothetical protein